MASRLYGGASSASTCNKNSFENTHIFDKTRLCKFYAKGKCKRGQACTFAHGEGEVHAQPDFFRTQLCADFVRSGACKLGSGCSYAHSPQELRRAKTHKSSRGKGPRKVVDPEVSLEVQRLEVMQHQAAQLRSQLHALQTIAGPPLPAPAGASGCSAPSAFKAEAGRSPKLADEEDGESDGDWLDVTTGFSRQSTEEGTEPPLCFSRQSTAEDSDACDDLASLPCSSDEELRLPGEAEEEEEEEEEEVACELLVKRTFISVEPAKAGSRRRTQSAPAVGRHGVV